MRSLGSWNRDQGVKHSVGSYGLGIFPFSCFSGCGLLCDNLLSSWGQSGRGNTTVLNRLMHANIPTQAYTHVFLRESRKKWLLFTKLLSVRCLQKSCLDHREGGAEDLWKGCIRKLGTWEFVAVKVNFEVYKLWKSWQIASLIFKKSKSLISGLNCGIWDSHLLFCLTLTVFLDGRQNCITFY